MERARKMATRGILMWRILSESRKSHPCSGLAAAADDAVSGCRLSGVMSRHSPARYLSSLPDCGSSRLGVPKTYLPGNHVGFGFRTISVDALKPSDTFPRRHNSATPEEQTKMAESCGFNSLDTLIDATVPKSIWIDSMKLDKFNEGLTESEMIVHMKRLEGNKAFKSFIGMGYYNTHVPPVILRNIMENPAWYMQYTPY
ncbi:hypothetical protein MLD38_015146 [Melastoma candidum]|uniref:Uncharacterized protein n=1 Tax=Melastoma candidum TaxID=119954 RepID=A0ACB9RFR8_9MYRT|nr:hypothetical protein MLD38_015146 [Melastoma candidum]